MSRLDDESLLKIFSKVRCARELAAFALVCKQWRDLSCAVDYLVFNFKVATKTELRTKEGIVASVLCRASSSAPGNLKHLCVFFTCREDAEVNGHWLVWTTSLTKLELDSGPSSLKWGPMVWNSIMRMKTLEELTLIGRFSTEKHLLLPQVLANGLQLPSLRICLITSYDNSISAALLETIFATCPALTNLRIQSYVELGALRVASNSLEIFSLFSVNHDGLEVTVRAPSLKTLNLVTGPVSTHFESAQSLRTLSLESPYKIYGRLENLQELKLAGVFRLQRLPEMLMLTPMITDLHFGRVQVADEEKIDIDQILAPLVNLRNVYFYCGVMSNLRAGERRFETLNVHIRPLYAYAPEVCLLKTLMKVHKIQSLVVHCFDMVDDDEEKAVRKGFEQWRFLFELSYFYPGRVKFVDEYSTLLYSTFMSL